MVEARAGILRRLNPFRREQKPILADVLAAKVKQQRLQSEIDHLDSPAYIVDQELVIPTGQSNILVTTFELDGKYTSTAMRYDPDGKSDVVVQGKAQIFAASLGEALEIQDKWVSYSTNLPLTKKNPRKPLDVNKAIQEKFVRSLYPISATT